MGVILKTGMGLLAAGAVGFAAYKGIEGPKYVTSETPGMKICSKALAQAALKGSQEIPAACDSSAELVASMQAKNSGRLPGPAEYGPAAIDSANDAARDMNGAVVGSAAALGFSLVVACCFGSKDVRTEPAYDDEFIPVGETA